jgi:DNA-binding response OmpR family regulator
VVKDNKTKILLIEDDKFICDAYKDGLEAADFEVILAYDGIEGMEKIKSEKPDLILLDLILPKKHGFKLLEEIKKDEKFKNIPVVILSNVDEEADVKKGIEMGAVDYLIKANFSIKEVIEKVKSHLKESKS